MHMNAASTSTYVACHNSVELYAPHSKPFIRSNAEIAIRLQSTETKVNKFTFELVRLLSNIVH